MSNLEILFERLGRSAFRNRFQLGPREADYLSAKGFDVVRQHAADFVATRLAPAQPINDGKQTPFRGHPVFIAQHATATCCRGCLAKWHALEMGRALDADQQERVVEVIMEWLRRARR